MPAATESGTSSHRHHPFPLPRALVLATLITAAVLTILAQPARAELVIFPDGSFLKVSAYEITGDRVRLELPSGGTLEMALVRVDRILEDEIVERPTRPEAPPRFSLRFDPSQPLPETPYAQLIYDAARRHALNPALVAAVVRAESDFRPTAISSRGARGLMQLMPATAQRFGIEGERVFDPASNIEAGTRYLSWLAERFDERLALVLAAYNAGEGTVDRYDGVPPYRETREYLRRIYAELGLGDDALSDVESPAAGGR